MATAKKPAKPAAKPAAGKPPFPPQAVPGKGAAVPPKPGAKKPAKKK